MNTITTTHTTLSTLLFCLCYASLVCSESVYWNSSSNPGDESVGVQNVPFTRVNASVPWRPRYFHSSVASAKAVVLLGGLVSWDANSNDTVADIWRSRDMGLSWELARASAPWGVRYSASLVLVNEGMVMAGGASDANTVWPDVWISDDLGSTWRRVVEGKEHEETFPARAAHTASVDITSNTIVLTGGYTISAGSTQLALNDVWTSRDSGKGWLRQVAAAPWTARYGATSFWRGSSVFVFGGVSISSSGVHTSVSDLWKSADMGVNWVQVEPPNTKTLLPRTALVSWSFGDILYIAGGASGRDFVLQTGADKTLGDVYASTDAGNSWSPQETVASFGPRAGHSVVVSGQTVLLMGGVNKGNVYNDVYRTDLPSRDNSSGGAVVAGILGACTGILIVFIAVRHCFGKLKFDQALQRLRKANRAEQPDHTVAMEQAQQADH